MIRTLGTSLAAAILALTAVSTSHAAPHAPPHPAPTPPQAAGPPRQGGDLDLRAAAAKAPDTKPGALHADPSGPGDFGGLPEPASWLLMVIGVGMIGGALRGFVVANRAIAKLQPEELE